MARARKCDICGRLYETYNTTGNKNKPNGIMFVSVTDADTYSRVTMDSYIDPIIDCCPDCIESIKSHVSALRSK